jgi:tubby-related protein 1
VDGASVEVDESGDDNSADPKDDYNVKFTELPSDSKGLNLGDARRSGRYDDLKPVSTQYAQQKTVPNNIPFPLVAHRSWNSLEHVQCTIVRDRTTVVSRLNPVYEMILESANRCIIIAKKMGMNSTSNYHLFDMTRGTPGSSLTKKSANYMGKLRALNSASTDYALVTSSMNKEEVSGITFERHGVVKHLKDGSQPRKMIVVLPSLDEDGVPIPRPVGESGGTILDELQMPDGSDSGERYRRFHSKDPVFENGNYRLNFRGRVTTPSVKNFQLVPEEDIDNIVCQFGKIGDDKFHLDFKAPLNAMQAFALALAQFNL